MRASAEICKDSAEDTASSIEIQSDGVPAGWGSTVLQPQNQSHPNKFLNMEGSDSSDEYPLVMTNIAKIAIEIVGFPINSMVIFQFAMLVITSHYRRVTSHKSLSSGTHCDTPLELPGQMSKM